MKIGICGKMCSGKSTFARLIKEKNNKYVIGSFAGKVYEIASVSYTHLTLPTNREV